MVENVGALTSAIELLNQESDSLVANFGKLADTSKTWNIISRLLSGSGLWQLQNRIRAIGNVVNLYNLNLAKSLEGQLDGMTSAKKMSETLVDLRAEYDLITKSDFYKQMKEGLIAQGYSESTAAMRAEMSIAKQYTEAIDALSVKQEKASKVSKISAFLSRGDVQDPTTGEMTTVENAEDRKFGQFLSSSIESQFLAIKDRKNRISNFFKEKKYLDLGSKVSAFFVGKAKALGRFIEVGLTLFGAFTKYLLIATLVIFLIRAIWPSFKEMLKAVGGLKKTFEFILNGIKDILYGVFNVFAGVFRGDFKRVFNGLAQIFTGLVKVVVGALFGLGQILFAALLALPLKIGKAFKKGILGRATGGPASGLTVVGERGPELLNLPAGSRVYSNSDSRRMSGNTINVHVNGRVGASDAEIRDIANKVAREINMRMNRTTSAVSRF